MKQTLCDKKQTVQQTVCANCGIYSTRRNDSICYRCNEKRETDALINTYASPVRSPFTPGIKTACMDRPELFFGRGKVRLDAKRLCGTCPVNLLCHEWATVNDEEGVWAGTTQDERRATRRAREGLTRQRLTLIA